MSLDHAYATVLREYAESITVVRDDPDALRDHLDRKALLRAADFLDRSASDRDSGTPHHPADNGHDPDASE